MAALVEKLPLNAVQAAVYTRLTDGTVGVAQYYAGIGDRILDELDQPETLPYIDIGSVTFDQGETKTRGIKMLEVSIHCFSAGAGMKELNDVMDAVLRSLTASPALLPLAAPFQAVKARAEAGEVFKEEDEGSGEITRHGILRYVIGVQQTS